MLEKIKENLEIVGRILILKRRKFDGVLEKEINFGKRTTGLHGRNNLNL